MKTGCFVRTEHIKTRSDIRNLFQNGKKVSVLGAKLFYMKNGVSENRIGFTLPKHYGTAVNRNRSKRLSREVYRHFRGHISKGYDMLLLIYPGYDSFSVRKLQLQQLILKAGLFC